MPTSKLYLQNLYEPTLTSATVASSGDVTFTLSVTPTYTKWFLSFSPSNAAQREIVYFDDVIGSTVYVKSENRWLGWTTAKAHTQGEVVAMKDVAEIFNFFSNNISSAFYVEKKGWLNVNVWWGSVFYNQAYQAFSDAAFVLTASTTNYIQYDYPTNTLSVSLTDWARTKAIVTTNSTTITNITYQVSKESYVDYTVALDDALPSQTGNAGKSLMTNWTDVSWWDPIPSQTGNSWKVLSTNWTTSSWAYQGITWEIKIWSTAVAPTSWLILDGAAVSRTTYAALFAVIGTTYWVGNWTTTFNIPDLRGRVAAGYDSTQTEFNTLGEVWGAKTHTLIEAEMPAHTHRTLSTGTGWSGTTLDKSTSVIPAYESGYVESAGSGAAHNNLQPYIALSYIIKT